MANRNLIQRRMNRVFEDFLGNEFFPRLLETEAGFTPVCDVDETDSRYLVSFDLPGVKKDDVKIEIQDNQLTISGERKVEQREGTGRWNRERYYGSFMRSFTLPSTIDAEKVEASYEDGVLQIAIPKTEEAKPKQIPIKEGKAIEVKKGKTAA